MRTVVILAALVLLGPSIGADDPPTVSLPPPLARVLTDYEAAWQGRNAPALAALFAENGFVISHGVPPVHGRAAIERHYAKAGGPLALRAVAYSTDGDLGYISGGFASRRGEPDEGQFTLLVARDKGGRWLIWSELDNKHPRPPVLVSAPGPH